MNLKEVRLNPRHYMSYWHPETVENMFAEAGDAPVDCGASSQYGCVQPGDTIWVMTVWEGERPALVARIAVDEVASRSAAARKLHCGANKLRPSKFHVLANPTKLYALKNIDLAGVMDLLQFPDDRNVIPLGKKDSALAARFRPMRLLSEAAVQALKDLWQAAGPAELPFGSLLHVFRIERHRPKRARPASR